MPSERSFNPVKVLAIGYLSYVLLGWIVLSLPVCQNENSVSALDNLFTATSAVSTTGLATVSTPQSYNFWGQLAILVMIQFGGIGYMTLGSFILLARKHTLSAEREQVARLSFVLPEGFQVRHFLRNVILFTVAIESLGGVALYAAFRRTGIEDAAWQATFHSISAFCTAGFSLFPSGLEQFSNDFWVNLIISALSLSGAIGFLVMSDIFWSFTNRKHERTLTSRIILQATFWSLLLGWALLFLLEPSLREMPNEERLMVSGFQAMSSLTTVGFNTVPIGSLSNPPLFLLLLLMIAGASPSGTGGGVKSTSISAALACAWSATHNQTEITFWGCKVPRHRITLAFATITFYICIFFVGGMLLLTVQTQAFEDILFETASALGTVGLSRGLTSDLTPLGKLIVIVLMFIGRVGPITFGLALFTGSPKLKTNDDIAI